MTERENHFQKRKYNRAIHPKFGIDEIKSETLNIDILVDDNCTANMGKDKINEVDYFRELQQPTHEKWRETIQDSWQSIKNIFN